MRAGSLKPCWLPAIIMLLAVASPCNAGRHEGKTIVLCNFEDLFFDIPSPVDTISANYKYFTYKENTQDRYLFFIQDQSLYFFYSQKGLEYKIYLPEDLNESGSIAGIPGIEKKIHLKTEIVSEEDENININHLIAEFDSYYEPTLANLTLLYYQPEKVREKLDSFLVSIENRFRGRADSGIFRNYIKYRIGLLEYHANPGQVYELLDSYLLNTRLQLNLQAYREFVNKVLSSYFSILINKDGFSDLYTVYNRSSLSELKSLLKKDVHLKNDTLLNYVILKESYEAYYTGNLKASAAALYVSELSKNGETAGIRSTASYLNDLFNFMKKGSKAPGFEAITAAGDSLVLPDSDNRMIYLGFCNTANFDCMKEIEYLKYLHLKHAKYLRLITILKTPVMNTQAMESFLNNYNWEIILWDEYPYIPELYRIKRVPVFFLLESDGNVIQDHPPNPSENFEYELFLILRARGIV